MAAVWLLAVLLATPVYGSAAAGASLPAKGCGHAAATCGVGAASTAASTPMDPDVLPTSAISPPAQPAARSRSDIVTVGLPVKTVAMRYGVSGEARTPPKTGSVTVPAPWRDPLGTCWLNQVILAPKGWTGRGLEGADGGEAVALQPRGESSDVGQRIVRQSDGACFGYGAIAAARIR